ncbi:MAG: glycerophosphodiester phosphodiesterase family protein [Christensenellales bacterium]|jgi:glycerophosphoryl diester phosphodiesterase
MEFNLTHAARGKTLVAAHRGAAAGNIPCNTIPAFDAALFQGADMLEIDISRSADGVLYVFHPGMEPVHLYSPRLIRDMHSREVDMLYLVNQDRAATEHRVPRLHDVLARYKGKCYINIDKFWMWPREIAEAVRAQNMQDQVLVKTAADPACFDQVEEFAPDLPYMVIARDEDDFTDALCKRNLRYVGVEALFAEESAPICAPEYIDAMHARGLILWGNAIVYDYRAVLSAGHTDDVSAAGNPDAGWGWLAARGFDIIQTDWIMPCVSYLAQKGYR